MKKIIFSAVLVTATVISFNSCVKRVVKPGETVTQPNEKLTCPLSDITTSSYFDLGVSLCGVYQSGQPAIGVGTTGALDTKLNCIIVEGPGCAPQYKEAVYSRELSIDINNGLTVLSDGIMTAAEQQSLITQIQNACNTHKNATLGSGYTISKYDCWFASSMCCPDDEIILYVNYKAITKCKN